MLLLTRVRRNGTVDLLILLQRENIERIKEYDAAEVLWPQLPPEYSQRLPHCIGVGFATDSDAQQIEKLVTAGKKDEAFQFATRGFKYRPESGDHDFGPIVLGKPTEGIKN